MPDPGPDAGTPAPSRPRGGLFATSFPVAGVAWLFGACVVVYAVAFWLIEHSRTRSGPWRIGFVTDAAGKPSIHIDQPALGIHGVEITFEGETTTNASLHAQVELDKPQRPLPFGSRIHEDLTFLPGVIAIDLFGHEVELATRVLVVDRQEQEWRGDLHLTLTPGQKPPPRPRPKQR